MSKTSHAFRFAEFLHEQGDTICTVFPPRPMWKKSQLGMREGSWTVGAFHRPRWFCLEPQTLFPMRNSFPWNGNLSWNGAEIFSRPRPGELVREAGFDRCDALLVEHWKLVPLIRAFQAERLVVLLTTQNMPTRKSPKVVRERFTEVLEDADEVWIEEDLELRLSLKVLAPSFNIVSRQGFGTIELWNGLRNGILEHS